MSDGRVDDLLELTLTTGRIPDEATPAERAEIASVLGAMGVLQAARAEQTEETRVSMPTARARFQRDVGYVAANQIPAPEPGTADPLPGRGFFGRLFGHGGMAALAGSAAGIGALVLVGAILWQVAVSGPTSAYAQMVEPGDYVQVEGVVKESSSGQLELQSELGRVDVELSDTTALVDAEAAGDLSTLKTGDRVLVAGIAGAGRKLLAQTVALSQSRGEPAPKVITFKQLERLRRDLEGQVVTYTLSSDGTRGAVLIETASGERFLVRVDGRSVEQLLSRASTALGQRVRVREGSGLTSGTFSLEVQPAAGAGATATPGPAEKTRFARVAGVVTSVVPSATSAAGRIIDGTLTIQTLRGPVTVIVRPNARVLPGDSGLSLGAGGRGEATGHTIVVTGGIDKQTGNVLADVIVMGPKLERPSR